MAPLVRTGGSRHTGLAALPYRNIQSTQKTVRNATVKFFLNTLSSLIGKIESDIKTNRLKMAEKRLHHTKCVNVSK